MKKYVLDLTVSSVEALSPKHVLIKLTDSKPLPEMTPGQFVEVRVDGAPSTFLRRPISINFVDRDSNELWLLVAAIGDGTRRLATLQKGDTLNCVLPLGNGFTMPSQPSQKVLLVGGGVGVAVLWRADPAWEQDLFISGLTWAAGAFVGVAMQVIVALFA